MMMTTDMACISRWMLIKQRERHVMSVAAAVCTPRPPTGVRSRACSSEHSSRIAADALYSVVYHCVRGRDHENLRAKKTNFRWRPWSNFTTMPRLLVCRCCWFAEDDCHCCSSCRILQGPRNGKSTMSENFTLKVEPLHGSDKVTVRVFVKMHEFGWLKCCEQRNTELQTCYYVWQNDKFVSK